MHIILKQKYLYLNTDVYYLLFIILSYRSIVPSCVSFGREQLVYPMYPKGRDSMLKVSHIAWHDAMF